MNVFKIIEHIAVQLPFFLSCNVTLSILRLPIFCVGFFSHCEVLDQLFETQLYLHVYTKESSSASIDQEE